jgi:hypothetical protein
MIKSTFLLLFFLIGINPSIAQIQNSNAKPEGKKVKTKKNKNKPVISEDSVTHTEVYLNAGFINSFRTFEDQTLSKYFSEWEEQTPINSFTVTGGAYIPLVKNLDMEIGVSLSTLGEKHIFQDSLTDSTFSYANKYRHIGIPLRLRYSFGSSNLKPYIFAGAIPTSIFQIRYESQYNSETGSLTENPITTTNNNLADFNLVLSGGVGVTYMKSKVGFSVFGEYRRNLLNTYDNYKIQHKLYGVNICAGFHIKL